MKKLAILFSLSASLSLSAQTQSETVSKTEIYTIVEKQAEFPGGMEGLRKFIGSNLKYPEFARICNVGGKTFVKFVVNEDGTISNTDVIKSSGIEALDAEAIRMVKSMPLWKAAEQSGKPVKCYFNLPVSFVIDDVYFVFNSSNTNENFLKGKQAVLENKHVEAMAYFQKAVGDVDAWYCLGVLCYINKDKAAAKRFFENVKLSSDKSQVAYQMSEKFLARCL